MKKRVLITGAKGNLGKHLVKSGLFQDCLAIDINDFDIKSLEAVRSFFKTQTFDDIIHCAALARLSDCENDPDQAILTNTVGTANLVVATLEKNIQTRQNIRFVHISTDGVYAGKTGNYSENDPTIPYTKYGWTKLSAEGPVRLLKNHCIIRTRFFDPQNITFDESATDIYTSKISVDELVQNISFLLKSNYVGLINVGGYRISDYEMNKKYKPDIRPCLAKDILKNISFMLHTDASMNTQLWEKIRAE